MRTSRTRYAATAALLTAAATGPAAASEGLDILARNRSHEQVVILYPGDQSTVFNNDGRISVQVLVLPLLSRRSGEHVELYLNGRRILHNRGKDFQLAGVGSGLNSLQARVVGANGKAIADSDPVSFYVWKTGSE